MSSTGEMPRRLRIQFEGAIYHVMASARPSPTGRRTPADHGTDRAGNKNQVRHQDLRDLWVSHTLPTSGVSEGPNGTTPNHRESSPERSQVDPSGHTDRFHWLNSWLQRPSFSNISRVSLYCVSSRPSITSRIALRVAALGITTSEGRPLRNATCL